MARRGGGWFTAVTALALSLALAIVPMADTIAPFRPDWVAILLICWTLIDARPFGLLAAFVCGLALDTLTGALLGQHALGLLVVTYLAQRFHLRVRMFPASQLTVMVVVLLALYQFVLFWVDGVAGRSVPLVERWGPVVSGAIVWPLLVSFTQRRGGAARVHI